MVLRCAISLNYVDYSLEGCVEDTLPYHVLMDDSIVFTHDIAHSHKPSDVKTTWIWHFFQVSFECFRGCFNKKGNFFKTYACKLVLQCIFGIANEMLYTNALAFAKRKESLNSYVVRD